MIYPFRMYGRIIQIYRFEAIYTEEQPNEQGELVEVEITRGFPTRAAAERTGGTVTELDYSAYEWLDGLEMPDVPNTYAEAVKVYEMGQEAYNALINTPEPQADTDAMLIDLEYRVTLLELGVM